ncbi:chorismate-binding protein [Novosphingobium resinovorum]|jgi:anthranilate synthase component 1|uniref:Anthranilate synthase component 1 n=1 Tax=Novosphingobium resinovorum TaxID=158500 RepID=A0A031K7B8_9SPHN|nr:MULTISPECIES: chorismate-binding protein [Novosphingobium]AOR75876.1 anthranilate synthase component I [Novosphingobium resinovorum]EZP84878.1 Anthranilate synthase component I [Novosphingobium resinovorum]MBF7011244.1 chorismate-binding protein [Novosphingobium sp. HR1a]WJM29228.1 chorismate-binding protein [Novosphingobium resinovorum]
MEREFDRKATLEQLAQGKPALVWRKLVADTETPVGAALKLIEDGRGDFLLESVEGGETRGRYSLLGLDPDLVFRASGEACEINRAWQADREAFAPLGGGTLAELRALVETCRCEVPAALPKALACLVGYFGYETIGLVEKLPRAPQSPLEVPDMLFVRPSLILIFDRLSDELFCVAPVWPETGDAALAVDRAAERIDEALRRLAAPAPVVPVATDLAEPVRTPVVAPEDYKAMALRAKDYIEAGDIFQVVLAQRFTCEFPLPPLALYRSLRRVNPSPFLYFLDLPGFALVGSSPEILVRVRDGEVTIRPIAGTRPRGASPAEDKANEAGLLADPKERAEHLMLLDLGRNDVGRVAAAGTVEVTDSYTIERYSHVMHIVSNVVGRLDTAKHDAIDAVFAGFPAGTVSGAPKVRACEVIAELEPETRGPYAGGVGYFAPDGSVDSCIVLRTGLLKDGVLHVQAGAGIVADSDPAYEQRECEAKSGALFAAAREAIRVAGEPGFGQ